MNPNQGGIEVVGAQPRQLKRGEFIPGARGLASGNAGGAPSGVAQFGDFFDDNQGRARVTAPMERKVMVDHMSKCRAWFSKFLIKARDGKGLQEHEEVPAILVLIMAMHKTTPLVKNQLLECMKSMAFPICVSTEAGITVPWERQQFTAVPWEVRNFTIAVATLMVEQCHTTVFDDANPLWDQSKEHLTSRRLTDGERPRIGPTIFRDPSEQEKLSGAPEFNINMDSRVNVGQGLMMQFGPHVGQSQPVTQQPVGPPSAAGSVPSSAEPEGVNLHQPTMTAAQAAAQAAGPTAGPPGA